MGTKVRFTGARTGKESISIYPIGVISRGDVVEVNDDIAERWTTQHPTGRPGTLEDLNDRWTKEQMQVIARDHKLDESGLKADLAKRLYDFDPHIAGSELAADFELAGGEEVTVDPTERTQDPADAVPSAVSGDGTDAGSSDDGSVTEGATDV